MNPPSRRPSPVARGADPAELAAPQPDESDIPGQPSKRPNILLLLSDQHRFDWTSLNPVLQAAVRTPNLERLAVEGTRFTNALCASPLCGPSRACLATGMEYDFIGIRGHERDWPFEKTGSHYRLMRDAGYHVAGCGKFDLAKASAVIPFHWHGNNARAIVRSWGFSAGLNCAGKWDGYSLALAGKELDPYYAYLDLHGLKAMQMADMSRRRNEHRYAYTEATPLPDIAYFDNWVAETGLQLLESTPKGKPWYLQINFSGPHEPMDITRLMQTRVGQSVFPPPVNDTGPFPEQTHQRIRRNYTAMVETIDHWIGVFLQALSSRGELDNTIVIYTSDHGEMLGDHSRWQKSVPHQPSIGIPLLLRGPGIRAGAVASGPTSLIDLAATALETAGTHVPHYMHSRSLWPVLSGHQSAHRQHVLSGLGEWRVVFDGRHKLVSNFEGHSSVLYDLVEDPAESHDLAPGQPDRVAAMQAAVANSSNT